MPAIPPSLDFQILREPRQLEALCDEWQELYERVSTATVFQGFHWNWLGWKHVGAVRGRRLFVLTGRQDGRIVLIWPLVVYRRELVRQVRWLGSETAEYPDVLLEPGPYAAGWLAAAWDIVKQQVGADIFYSHYVREDAAIDPILRQTENTWHKADGAHFVDWQDWTSWDDYFQSLSERVRRELRRCTRRLVEKGTVSFERAGTAAEAEEILNWMFKRKRDWILSTGRDGDWFLAPEHQRFVTAFVREQIASGDIFLNVLKVDDRIIASDLSFYGKGWLGGWLSAYGQDWAKFSPGSILRQQVLQISHAKQHRVFDFRPSREHSFKQLWAKKELPVSTYLVPLTNLGRVYVKWYASPARRLLRAAYQSAHRLNHRYGRAK